MQLVNKDDRYVVKVDQGVKGRFKKGLVLLDVQGSHLANAVTELKNKGYESILIEPYINHDASEERYLSISNSRKGYVLSYNRTGGVDVEANAHQHKTVLIGDSMKWDDLSVATGLSAEYLESMLSAAKLNHISFLEINPYIITKGTVRILDCAAEVDDAAFDSRFEWSQQDIRDPRGSKLSAEEKRVRILDESSPASFNLSVLNKNGSIFLLLSGGGASVVIADEIYNAGFGKELADYGEYSGNPSRDETGIYAAQVLSLLVASAAPKKVLFIGGAAANFTDIATTFDGILDAMTDVAGILKDQDVKVYVRRGGPRQEQGLAKMQDALKNWGLFGGVYDPSVTIATAVDRALGGLKR